MNLYAYVHNDPVNATDPTGEYGRGSGWTDDEWKKFDSAQQQAAGRIERGADALEAAADELKAGGDLSDSAQRTISAFQKATGQTATAKNLRQTAQKFSKAAKALRDDGSKGYVANAISRLGVDVFASVNKVGGKTMTVNVGHGRFRGSTLGHDGWALVGHESLHSAGLDDERWSGNGMRAYRRGTNPGHREAYRNLPPNQRIKNPDHLMSIIDPW